MCGALCDALLIPQSADWLHGIFVLFLLVNFTGGTYSIEQFSIMIMLNTIVRTILRHNWMRQAAEVTINEFDVYAWLFADVKVYRLFGTFSAGKMDCIGMRVTNH